MPLGPDVSSNISELHHGPRYKRNRRKFGKKKAHQIAIAAAFSGARASRRKSPGTSWESGLRRAVR